MTDSGDWAHLNTQQYEAVTHGTGPQLVLAGAGSGKTRVITSRIAWLVKEQGIDPAAISAVTFTNKAAAEMKRRVEESLGVSSVPTYVGTFHRYALRLLRRYGERVGLKPGFSIADDADQLALVRQALKDESLPDSSFPPRGVLSKISDAKNRLVSEKAFQEESTGFYEERLARLYVRYQQLLRRASSVDFDDLIALTVRLLQEDRRVLSYARSRAHYLLVDEFQDTNHAQLKMVEELAGEDGNLTAVGDEDQGIYRWRGADLDNILHFERFFPGAVIRKLERNYRSTQNILSAADAVVANNENRRGKTLWTDAGAGDPISLYRARDEGDEAAWAVRSARHAVGDSKFQDVAILVRTNGQTRALEEELIRTETPYSLVGGTRFYARAEIKDLVAYLRVVRDPNDEVAMQRILNQPPRGIGKTTRDLVEDERTRRGLTLWDYLRLDGFDTLPTRAAKALAAFRDLIRTLHEDLGTSDVGSVLDAVLERTHFLDLFKGQDTDSEARRENVDEMLNAAHGFVSTQGAALEEAALESDAAESGPLDAFLDHVALVSDLDDWQVERGVSVMTMHSAKGLEFPYVLILGLEQGVLPHYNSQESPEDLEEERRLLYVGMTRAREKLFISGCRRRMVAGRYQDQQPSPFLMEIPRDLVEAENSPSLFDSPRSGNVGAFFGRGTTVVPVPEEDEASRGRRVRHATLGEGTVLSIEGSGGDAKLTIYFDDVGKRKLIAKYSNLELVH